MLMCWAVNEKAFESFCSPFQFSITFVGGGGGGKRGYGHFVELLTNCFNHKQQNFLRTVHVFGYLGNLRVNEVKSVGTVVS